MNRHHTKLKGDIAEQAVAFDLTKRGYHVSKPLSKCCPYDLIYDDGANLFRVQVKYREDCMIPSKSGWTDAKGCHSKSIDPLGFDFIALVNVDLIIAYCLPEMLGCKVRFTRPKSFNSYYWYEDFSDPLPICPEKIIPSQSFFAPTERKSRKGSSEKISWPTRDELSKLVWEIPTTKVSELLGVSDAAIYKRCKNLGIEKPPRGHWAKVAFGKE